MQRSPAAPAVVPFLNPALSLYLDLVRCLAALAVLVGHFVQRGYGGDSLLIGAWSHEAVVFFFVLSGLVIAHSTHGKPLSWREYGLARATHLYSVVVPAFLLGVAAQAVALWQMPTLAVPLAADLAPANVLGSLLFLGESWGLHASLPWNGAFWSLCYEVWYYVLFGVFLFVHNWRWWWFAAAACLAGPAILLMAPLWWGGAWLARRGGRLVQGPAASALLWVVTLVLMAALKATAVDVTVRDWFDQTIPGYWHVSGAKRWLTDYLWALLIMTHFVAFRGLDAWLPRDFGRAGRAMVFVAGYTFSLYLYHLPLLHLLQALAPPTHLSHAGATLAMLGTIGACVLLGHFTEKRKEIFRRALRPLFGVPARRA